MKIGIDARLLGSAQGGLGRYIEELTRHLENLNPGAEFVIFLRKNNWDSYRPSNPKFSKVLADIPWYGWKEQLLLPRIFSAAQVDLMHFPHWNVPLLYKKPFIVTIHDLLLVHHPTRRASTLGPIRYLIKDIIFKIVLTHAARASQAIIAPSVYTKNDIAATLGIAPAKIAVTYLAPHQPTPAPNALHDKQTRASLNITKPYVLYVGVSYPHKNLEMLLKAWTQFKQKYAVPHQLVLVGKKNYFYSRLLTSDAAAKCPDLLYTDYVSDENLPALYRGSSLYVMPSLYEGFGLPALEAMHYGVPVISSSATCLPEILQKAALYFNPTDQNELVQALYNALTDEKIRQTLAVESKNLLERYSWKKCAQETWEIYQHSV